MRIVHSLLSFLCCVPICLPSLEKEEACTRSAASRSRHRNLPTPNLTHLRDSGAVSKTLKILSARGWNIFLSLLQPAAEDNYFPPISFKFCCVFVELFVFS